MDQNTTQAAPAVIPMQQVKSSNIAACGYDAPSRTLAVAFASGTYHFADVPPEVASGLASAESPGKFFAQQVRGRFTSTKQEPPKDDGLRDAEAGE